MQYRIPGKTGVNISERDNPGAIGWSPSAADERRIDALVPPGEHTGKGYNDPQYPVRGRVAS